MKWSLVFVLAVGVLAGYSVWGDTCARVVCIWDDTQSPPAPVNNMVVAVVCSMTGDTVRQRYTGLYDNCDTVPIDEIMCGPQDTPIYIWAYEYGDPNKEKITTTWKGAYCATPLDIDLYLLTE